MEITSSARVDSSYMKKSLSHVLGNSMEALLPGGCFACDCKRRLSMSQPRFKPICR
jgi:hypothetical protein